VGDIETPKVAPVPHTCLPSLRDSHARRRDALRERLATAGIITVLNYPKALPLYPAYAYLKHTQVDFPVAHANQSRILSCRSIPEMTAGQFDHIVDSIKQFLREGGRQVKIGEIAPFIPEIDLS